MISLAGKAALVVGSPAFHSYCAGARGGAIAFVKTLSTELDAPVNTVAPGWPATFVTGEIFNGNGGSVPCG